MNNLPMIPFRNLVKQYCRDLEESTIAYIQSQEFRKSEYDKYTKADLVQAICNEEREDIRAVLCCLLVFKAERNLF